MMGRSHLVAGTAVSIAGLSSLYAVKTGALNSVAQSTALETGGFRAAFDESLSTAIQYLSIQVWQWIFPAGGVLGSMTVYLILAAVLFLVGSLAPDMDSKQSLLGRHLHVPGPHRGVLHTDYFWLAVTLLVSIPEPSRMLFWLGLGALIHCELDGLSKAGRVRWYPLTKYKIITQHGEPCVVTSGWRTGFYKTNKISEHMVLGSLVVLCAAITASAWWLMS